VPVGRELCPDVIPLPAADPDDGGGSIIAILATDAPLLPHQCERLAQRAGLGVARAGGGGEHSSGDLFLAFSTGNRGRITSYKDDGPSTPVQLDMLPDAGITDLFWAAIESTEEAILNALVAAETMTGRDGVTAHALDHERLVEVMIRYGRGPR
jgi:D-aminopeptidase